MGIKRRNLQPMKSLLAIEREMLANAEPALVSAALLFIAEGRETLSTPGQGRLRSGARERLGKGSFNVGKDGKLHMVRRGAARTKIDLSDRASAPGDPPAPDKGYLRASLGYEVVSPTKVRVGVSADYAAALEFGTSTIVPRPFMRPTMERVRGTMTDLIVSELRRRGKP